MNKVAVLPASERQYILDKIKRFVDQTEAICSGEQLDVISNSSDRDPASISPPQASPNFIYSNFFLTDEDVITIQGARSNFPEKTLLFGQETSSRRRHSHLRYRCGARQTSVDTCLPRVRSEGYQLAKVFSPPPHWSQSIVGDFGVSALPWYVSKPRSPPGTRVFSLGTH